ncbi:MAG: trypsin-like peptidase domain-containing protein [Candidatus Zixiibacteriota bacterium]|nr:MAG: trypsin-like peptidase domain-containing protein [candidate division Zixibacteria bacterium]
MVNAKEIICKKYYIFISVLFIVVVLKTAKVFGFTRQEVIKDAKDEILEIRSSTDAFLGTAFFIDSIGNAITCYHVLYDEKTGLLKDSVFIARVYALYITGNGSYETLISFPFTVDTFSVEYDAAVIKIDFNRASMPVGTSGYLELADSIYSEAGDDIVCLGYVPSKYTLPRPFALHGIVSTIRPFVTMVNQDENKSYNISILQLDMTAVGGVSGSPIIDLNTNEVIAYMVEVNLPGKFKQSGFSTAYSITNIKDLIEVTRKKDK